MKNINDLFEFIEKSASAFHTVATVKDKLVSVGYTELCEGKAWELTDGGKYFVVRNGTSIIAFNYKENALGFNICASHSDSPAFRLKLTEDTASIYTRLEVEKYGGMILYSWLDRPLSIAGRVVVKDGDTVRAELVNLDYNLAVIPSVAIHLNRGVNDGYKFNPATDMLPLVASGSAKGRVIDEVAKAVSVKARDIISHDLFLYNREKGSVIGVDGEFILSPRLDDLECAFASTEAFLSAKPSLSIPVLAIFDNEEVGSQTKQGADSDFLMSTLARISGDNRDKMLYNSFMVSADNAHAKHPNHPELSDPDNAPILNGGIVIKWNANQRYATDGVSDAIFTQICKRAGVKTQRYYNRADMLGGSTLGSIANTKVSIPTVDIGLSQLAMHSATETAGKYDVEMLSLALEVFYSTSIIHDGDKYELK